MTRRIAELTCPECQKPIQVPFDAKEAPTLDEITTALNEAFKARGEGAPSPEIAKELDELLKKYQSQLPAAEDHKHKTADEFLDCPECHLWFETTAKRYKVIPAEPTPAKDNPPKQPAIASIFGPGGKTNE